MVNLAAMKRTTSIHFLLIALIFLLFSSEGKSQISEPGDMYVGLQVSPNFTYRVLSNSTDDPAVDDLIRSLNNSEESAFGYRIGATMGIKFARFWDIEGGISYSRHCTEFNDYLLFGDQTDPRRGLISTNETYETADLKTCYEYLGIPLRLIWNFGTENIKVLASFGITPQILMKDEQILRFYRDGDQIDKQEFENIEDVNGFNLSPQLGIGAQFRLKGRFFLRTEGIARFGVININEDSPINSYLYSSEINVGLYYRLNPKEES